MTPEEYQRQAAQDLDDIASLRRVPAWERWFVRRMNQKIAQENEKALRGERKKKDREVHRQRMLLLEEVLRMPDEDQNCAREAVNQP